MFNYLLSVAVAFIFFGFIFNILKKTHRDTIFKNFEDEELVFFWFIIIICAAVWFITIPVGVLCLVIFLLKLLTDKIADSTLNLINQRKLKKQSKQETKDGH